MSIFLVAELMMNGQYEEYLNEVKKDGLYLKNIKKANQTYELCMEAIKQNPFAFNFVSKKIITPEMVLYVAKNTTKTSKHLLELILENMDLYNSSDENINFNKELLKNPIIAQKIVLLNGQTLKYIENQNEEMCLEAVKQRGDYLKDVKEQTSNICLAAVKRDGWSLKYVKEKTKEICLEAVKQRGDSLEYVPKEMMTEEICLEAIKNDGRAIKHIEKPTYEMCMNAVREDGYALMHIVQQTEELCIEAIKNEPYAFISVKNQTENICKLALSLVGDLIQYVERPTKEMFVLAVKENPKVLEMIENPYEEVIIEALKLDGNLIKKIKNKTPKFCWYAYESTPELLYLKYIEKGVISYIGNDLKLIEKAVELNGLLLEFIKQQTENICIKAVSENGMALKFVENQTENICLEAVKQNGMSLEFVKNQTDEICIEAVKQNGKALKLVENQTEDICIEAVGNSKWAMLSVKNQTIKVLISFLKCLNKTEVERSYAYRHGSSIFSQKRNVIHNEKIDELDKEMLRFDLIKLLEIIIGERDKKTFILALTRYRNDQLIEITKELGYVDIITVSSVELLDKIIEFIKEYEQYTNILLDGVNYNIENIDKRFIYKLAMSNNNIISFLDKDKYSNDFKINISKLSNKVIYV